MRTVSVLALILSLSACRDLNEAQVPTEPGETAMAISSDPSEHAVSVCPPGEATLRAPLQEESDANGNGLVCEIREGSLNMPVFMVVDDILIQPSR